MTLHTRGSVTEGNLSLGLPSLLLRAESVTAPSSIKDTMSLKTVRYSQEQR